MDEFLKFLIEAGRTLGAGGTVIFMVLYYLERKERIECQKSMKELLILSLNTAAQATNSITTVTSAVSELREAIKETGTSLGQLIRSIKRER